MNLLVAAIVSAVVLLAMIILNFSTYNGAKNSSKTSRQNLPQDLLFKNSLDSNEKKS